MKTISGLELTDTDLTGEQENENHTSSGFYKTSML